MNKHMIKAGMIKFDNFINKLNLDIKVRTPHTNFLEELGTMSELNDDFKIKMIHYLYHEFYSVNVIEEEK